VRKRIGQHADEVKSPHRSTTCPLSRRSNFAKEMSWYTFEPLEQLLISLVIKLETFEELVIIVILFDRAIYLI
jgi:hypothetical protein